MSWSTHLASVVDTSQQVRWKHDEVVRILHREICKRDIESEDHALNTILDGIEIGKRMPIRDVIARRRRSA